MTMPSIREMTDFETDIFARILRFANERKLGILNWHTNNILDKRFELVVTYDGAVDLFWKEYFSA